MAKERIKYPGTIEDEKPKGLCVWNDHGHICNLPGSLSDCTKGEGPWFCSVHYWRLKGAEFKPPGQHKSYRERWYEEHKQDYKPAVLGDIGHWRSIGRMRPPARQREPGEDEEELGSQA